MKSYKRLGDIYNYLVLLIFLFILLFPHFIMLTTAFKKNEDVYNLRWFPKEPQFRNIIDIWDAIPLGNYIANSIFITVGSILLILILSVTAGYATSRLKMRGKKLFLYSTIALSMFGAEIFIIGLFKVILKLRLIDTYGSLILVNTAFNLPPAIWIIHNYLKSIPHDIDDSAKIDGARNLQILLYIILPIVTPSIIVITIISFLNTWNEFLVALTFISTPLKKPITVGLQGFVGYWQTKWNLLMLGALISTLPVLILMLFSFKHMKGGLILGSLKT